MNPDENASTGGTDEIAKVGADVNVKVLMEEVRAEVERKRKSGVYPAEITEELDRQSGGATSMESLKAGISALQSSVPISIEARITSSRPALTPVVSSIKRAIHRAVAWYMASIVEQVNNFATRSVRMFDQIVDRSEDLDSRISEIEARLERLHGEGESD